jgi:hypothetical protein
VKDVSAGIYIVVEHKNAIIKMKKSVENVDDNCRC